MENSMTYFDAACRPTLIGSLPSMDGGAALDLVMTYTPHIPHWVQMPGSSKEGMIQQFAPGLPGLAARGDTLFVDNEGPAFDAALADFYEAYMAVNDGSLDFEESPFVLAPERAEGFYAFLGRVEQMEEAPIAVKGQITGPITFCTGLKDKKGRAILFDEQVRDAAVKMIAMKARWQVRQLAIFGVPVVIFLDEPALAGFGSSELIGLSKENAGASLDEVFEAVHAEGGVTGIHVCANTDWSMVMESQADIVNFDAYGYFDRFVLYESHIVDFFRSDRVLAWGLIPTLNPEDIAREDAESLAARFFDQVDRVSALGIETAAVLSRSLITPSCGAGSLTLDLAEKVLRLVRDVSEIIRKEVDVW
jgi:methionine synthase II (cobalamin-independent)